MDGSLKKKINLKKKDYIDTVIKTVHKRFFFFSISACYSCVIYIYFEEATINRTTVQKRLRGRYYILSAIKLLEGTMSIDDDVQVSCVKISCFASCRRKILHGREM